MDGARDQFLAGAALAGDQHRQIVALHPLNLIDDARHRGAGAEKPGQQRLERSIDGEPDRTAIERSRAAHSANPCRATAAIIRTRRMTGWPIGRGEATSAKRGPSASRPSGSTISAPRPYAVAVRARSARACARASASQPADGDHADVAARQLDEDHGAVGGRGFEQRRGRFARRADPAARPHPRSAARSHRRHRPGRSTYSPRADRREQSLRGARVARDRARRRAARRPPRAWLRWRSAVDRAPVCATRRPSARWLSAAW